MVVIALMKLALNCLNLSTTSSPVMFSISGLWGGAIASEKRTTVGVEVWQLTIKPINNIIKNINNFLFIFSLLYFLDLLGLLFGQLLVAFSDLLGALD